jgi:predicted secreted protein
MLVLTQSDRGRTVSVGLGTRFHIELEENRTTGFSWSAPEFSPASLTLESDDTVPGAAVGGAGLRRFVFKVTAEGRTTIRLVSRRPWAKDASDSPHFEVTIVSS